MRDFRESIDAVVADRFTSTEMNSLGLPGFLGCSFIDVRNDDRIVCIAQGTALLRDPKP